MARDIRTPPKSPEAAARNLLFRMATLLLSVRLSRLFFNSFCRLWVNTRQIPMLLTLRCELDGQFPM